MSIWLHSLFKDGECKKLDKKAQKLWFIGYTETAANYKVWDENKQRCYIRHDVIFNESDFKTSPETSKQEPEGTEEPLNSVQIEAEETEQENTQEEQLQPVRHSQRVRKIPIHYGVDELLTLLIMLLMMQ